MVLLCVWRRLLLHGLQRDTHVRTTTVRYIPMACPCIELEKNFADYNMPLHAYLPPSHPSIHIYSINCQKTGGIRRQEAEPSVTLIFLDRATLCSPFRNTPNPTLLRFLPPSFPLFLRFTYALLVFFEWKQCSSLFAITLYLHCHHQIFLIRKFQPQIQYVKFWARQKTINSGYCFRWKRMQYGNNIIVCSYHIKNFFPSSLHIIYGARFFKLYYVATRERAWVGLKETYIWRERKKQSRRREKAFPLSKKVETTCASSIGESGTTDGCTIAHDMMMGLHQALKVFGNLLSSVMYARAYAL